MRILTILLSCFFIAASASSGIAQKASDSELEFWRSIKGSKDPAEFRAYLKAFPNGVFASIARIRLKRLAPNDPAATAKASPPQLPKPDPQGKPPAQANSGGDGGSAQPKQPPAKVAKPDPKDKPKVVAKPNTPPPPASGGGAKPPATAKTEKPTRRLPEGPRLAGPSPMGALKRKSDPNAKEDAPDGASAGMVPPPTAKPAPPGNPKIAGIPDIQGDFGAIGVQLKWYEPKDAAKAGLPEKSGATVTELHEPYPSVTSGLKVGDFIIAADGKPIRYLIGLINLIRKKPKGARVELTVSRDGKETKVTVPVGRMLGTPLRSARAGNATAMVRLALIYFSGVVGERNSTEGQIWLNKAVGLGDPFANFIIGGFLERGVNGFNLNRIRAFRSYKAAADKGYADASFAVGRFYEKGLAGETDPVKARAAYETAVKGGHLQAHIRLGEMLLDGKGGDADPLRAVKMFENASKKGLAEAGYRLAKLYQDGAIGIQQDCTKALAGYKVALSGYEAGAAWGLGLLYLDGCGVAKDREKAISYFRRAALLDHRGALDKLDQMGLSAYSPREIQELLDELGYRPGTVDGKPGQQTRRAIRKFQRDNDLDETGELSLALLKQLRKAAEAKRKKSAEEKNPPPKLWVPQPVAGSGDKKSEGSQFSERSDGNRSRRSRRGRSGGSDSTLDGLMGGDRR
ncbi:MAG: SEL1-like repeat protein [Hyphomicrobiaceae bacterium]|nr:SEL1-like repeat protein [Hyphomicrobiaceae bacterium]